MKRYSLLFLGLTALIFSCNAQGNNNAKPANAPKATVVAADTAIQWLTFEEALKLNETAPKKIFIDFYTDWCGWCKVMDKNTFKDPNVIKLMNKYFYPVKFNAEQRAPIDFKGKTYTFIDQGGRGYHELAAAIMQGQLSYPTFMFLTPDFQIITPLQGYVKKEDFEPIVNFLGQDFFLPEKNMVWEDYKAKYKPGQDL